MSYAKEWAVIRLEKELYLRAKEQAKQESRSTASLIYEYVDKGLQVAEITKENPDV